MEKFDFGVLDLVIKASGWDEVDTCSVQFFDVTVDENVLRLVPELKGTDEVSALFVNYQNGQFEAYNGDNVIIASGYFKLTR
jgi:hypothetical protein